MLRWGWSSSPTELVLGLEGMASSYMRVGCEENLLPVSGQPLERAAQGGDRVTVPAGVQGTLDVPLRDVA